MTKTTPSFKINSRPIGPGHPPFVIAEIGINHEGSEEKALQMIEAAANAGAECVKFQTHVIEDEMIPTDVIPGNADESIWDIMSRCVLDAKAEARLKKATEDAGMIFLSTPFSRAAAIQLNELGVRAYKIGSGECNNYPLIRHIANYGKPIILSTGMNDIESVKPAVDIFREFNVPFALLHCTSMYPTPFEKVRLGAMQELADAFPDAIIGLSDHTQSIAPALGAVALGAHIIERHFTADASWPGPDIEISDTPEELARLIEGSNAVFKSLGGSKEILSEEQPTIDFAYACVVATKDIDKGEVLSEENIWVKRPGTGEIKAIDYENVLGKVAAQTIPMNSQLKWDHFK